MTTQKDVAQRAGVSFITVSRVINGETNVKEATRQRVEAAIRELGYSPGFAGKALNSGRCNTIGVLTPIPLTAGTASLYLTGILAGLERSCRSRANDILLGVYDPSDASFDYLRPYRQRKADGIIYIGLQGMPAAVLAEVERLRLPCAVIGDRPEHPGLSWVDSDNETAASDLVRRLWKAGCRRIAFHGLETGIFNANISAREAGWRRAIRELTGTAPEESIVIRSTHDPASVSASLRAAIAAFQNGRTPDALVCSAADRIPAAFAELTRAGISVPADMVLAGFDATAAAVPLPVPVVSCNQPLAELGSRAAEIVFEHIDNPAALRRTEILPVSLHESE